MRCWCCLLVEGSKATGGRGTRICQACFGTNRAVGVKLAQVSCPARDVQLARLSIFLLMHKGDYPEAMLDECTVEGDMDTEGC